MKIKMIHSEEDYQAALALLNGLMDAVPGSPEEEELDLLSFLVDKFEEEHFPIDLPDPVEAIKFRMDQQGLTQKDLVRYIGSQSKVSEVLNRKRSLSLAMIRSLHLGLGIPVEVLLQEPGKSLEEPRFKPEDFPLKEMVKAGYFPGVESLRKMRAYAEELLISLFSPLVDLSEQVVYCRNSSPSSPTAVSIANGHEEYTASTDVRKAEDKSSGSGDNSINENALRAWQAKVLRSCMTQKIGDYSHKVINRDFIRRVVQLSSFSNGPLLAKQVLLESGVHFISEPHLPKTYLDGACFKTPAGHPVIGLTLRHDRLDNFWFTLVHELSHILLHLEKENIVFFDDIEHGLIHDCSEKEVEANQLTMDLLIPNEKWLGKKEEFLSVVDDSAVINFAGELGISPAIVAGRIRWESRNYSIYKDLLGARGLKELFV
ncbi:MAG TPA: ImmA/IrrE family metallo-endopeptidase [Pelolinea sp.]|nr:ImmA/IrrE family metallo-endopeptidase [Pelolinea sp.]